MIVGKRLCKVNLIISSQMKLGLWWIFLLESILLGVNGFLKLSINQMAPLISTRIIWLPRDLLKLKVLSILRLSLQ